LQEGSLATNPLPRNFVPPLPASNEWFVRDLLKLQKAAHEITSTLDLDELISRVVNDVAVSFGCIETAIWLIDERDPEIIRLVGVEGCSLHKKGIELRIGREGMIGNVAATGLVRYAPDVSQDPYFIACEPGTNSELDIPLKIGDKVIGVFSVVHNELDAFPADQRRLLEALCEHIAVAVQNARAFRREREQREAMQREAKEARFIQRSLLPCSSPYLAGFALEALTTPAGEVGGDWYDYIDLGEQRWGIVLADVAGKGMAAALLMSATRGILRAVAPATQSPSEVLSRLNNVLKDDFPAGRYVTMVYGILDGKKHTFTFANAGHPHPVLVEGNEASFVDGVSGLPLGLGDSQYADRVIQLRHGIKLLMYSDGISEAENRNGEEFGKRRIAEHLLREHTNAQTLMDESCEFSYGPRADDSTVILIRCAVER
jgi:sigma-B regulation protein RsbU (phosphoserine phosphatase)